MTFDIKAKKDENEEQTLFQRDENINELKNRQKSRQTLMRKFENRENIFRSNNDDVVTSLNDNVDYVELVIKKKIKTKNLKSIKDNEVKASSTRHRKITEIDENFLVKVSKLKRQRLIINLKSTNLDIYNDKNFKKFKN